MNNSDFIQFTLQLADMVGIDIVGIRAQIGNMLGLNTNHKTTLVGAINEVNGKVGLLNGLQFESDPATATLKIKDGSGNLLTSISLAYLNNEGTRLSFNLTNETIELINDEGQVLSAMPVSAFLTNLVSSANFNGTTPSRLDFKDNAGTILFSIDYKIANIQGLQAALDTLTNKIGSLPALDTTDKTNLVVAINEVNVSKNNKEDIFYNSYRDFTQGTLIETDIDYSQIEGDEFLLEIKANTYNSDIPLLTFVQGYIYDNTLINYCGFSTASSFNQIIALNLSGKLHFWFPRIQYWQGFSVKVNSGNSSGGLNRSKQRVVGVYNNVDPVGTKRVAIGIKILATRDYADSLFVKKDGSSTMTSYLKFNNGWSSGGDASQTAWYRFFANGKNPISFGPDDGQIETLDYGTASQWYEAYLAFLNLANLLANKANINGSNTTGGSWKMDYILSDVLTGAVGNGQVLVPKADGTIDYGSTFLNSHRFQCSSINGLKIGVDNVGTGDIWHQFNMVHYNAYGLGNDLGVVLPNNDANILLKNGKYTTNSLWTGSPYPGSSGLNQGYLTHENWHNSAYAVQKFINVNSEIHNMFRIKDNGVWSGWIRLADHEFVNDAIANISLTPGPKGDKPAHSWSGTQLRFENPNGTWGTYVDLKGNDGYTPQKNVDYFDGQDGYTPQKGTDYFDGAQGQQGIQGVKGDKGDKGDQGIQGLPGYTPVKGTDYFDGSQGQQGIQGIKGDKGDKGDPGIQGIQGNQGIQGIQGIQGAPGTPGAGSPNYGVEVLDFTPGSYSIDTHLSTTIVRCTAGGGMYSFDVKKGKYDGDELCFTSCGHEYQAHGEILSACNNGLIGGSSSTRFIWSDQLTIWVQVA